MGSHAPTAGVPRLSRSLLLPGALPPHTHFGATLLRHVVATGLRAALHRLGLPLIEAPPVRIVSLRLYLDRRSLDRQLAGAPGAAEAVAALLDPGGAATDPAESGRLAGAGLVHRLRIARRGRLPPWPPLAGDPWGELRTGLSALLPALSDALLAELLASLARRRRRAAGRPQAPCLGREAWRFRAGRAARHDHLGPPEPLLPSWSADPEAARRASAGLGGQPPPRHRLRGRFRERYRAALDVLAPRYRALAESATERGLLDDPSDAFFIPFDVAEDLTAERRPSWLAPAVAANRREYLACHSQPCPPDQIDPDSPPVGNRWEVAPLSALP